MGYEGVLGEFLLHQWIVGSGGYENPLWVIVAEIFINLSADCRIYGHELGSEMSETHRRYGLHECI